MFEFEDRPSDFTSARAGLTDFFPVAIMAASLLDLRDVCKPNMFSHPARLWQTGAAKRGEF
jgi:hypothetical protein